MNTNTTLHALMREATRLTKTGQLGAATQAIQQALGNNRAGSGFFKGAANAADDPSLILDGCVFDTGEHARGHDHAQTDLGTDPGTFTSGSHTHAGITRRYKLYTPPCTSAQPTALVVMLHGCTQNPDDFAAGTGMNTLAREQGFMVLYPEQAQDANPQRCWNWFKHNHQKRGSGEPALIANLTQKLVQQHGMDPRRVYIAGLSAGGAMAAIIAQSYPDVFAAAGVHSGLPSGAAVNVAEALAAMKNGSTKGVKAAAEAVPTIVFHGDRDHTVHPRNGEQVLASALAHQTGNGASHHPAPVTEHGVSPRGRRFTRLAYSDASGAPVAEHWVLHGAGHAWSGGSASGSYTDTTGPDATREMLRFFFSQPHGPAH